MSQEVSIIFGRHPVLEALHGGVAVDKVLLQRGVRGPFERELRQACQLRRVPLVVVPPTKLQQLVRGNHQGVVAWIAPVAYHRLEDLLPLVYERGEAPLIVVLDGVTDVRNFGAIARSAELCGAHALVVSVKHAAPINADALKTSAGALARLPVCREPSALAAVTLLQESGIRVLATDLQADRYIFEEDLRLPVALVVGGEQRGISRQVQARADASVRIPQRGALDSFNVSVAAGIVLYEAVRQRMMSVG